MDEIREASQLESRLQRIEECLRAAGLMERPETPAPPPEPPLVPSKVLVQPFRGSPNHPLSVYFSFECPHCSGGNKLTVFVPGRGIVKVVCGSCHQFSRVDLQWERT